LMDLYQDKMSSEGDRLFAPYAGKWMNLTETVSDVSGNLVTAFEKAPNGAYRTINIMPNMVRQRHQSQASPL